MESGVGYADWSAGFSRLVVFGARTGVLVAPKRQLRAPLLCADCCAAALRCAALDVCWPLLPRRHRRVRRVAQLPMMLPWRSISYSVRPARTRQLQRGSPERGLLPKTSNGSFEALRRPNWVVEVPKDLRQQGDYDLLLEDRKRTVVLVASGGSRFRDWCNR